ncbi:GatB/YqeY domain-containing protein [Thiosulfativibrio zosterae]|uniref:Aspartyl-tRNA amidotransferase subunit B n=1 Tax=Thiosulfativibrio zosterae TaxID=2675053 RepID=A0A6F8PL29_9GAMM|nr:GatB/YqeY domain-containing protein [Thiosulfativibrio zosterae]BBP42811.1 aspartyl-tRNA amidotransferase subunit B [Thiosulfativibrio zosterae]
MSCELKATLSAAMKEAMKAKQKERLLVIRTIQAAIKQVEIDNQITIEEDAEILPILDKMLKQRRESEKQYIEAGRPELAEVEAFEMTVIQEFLPQALTTDEIQQMIEVAVAESGAATMQEMGKVMAILKPQMQGRADMSEVSKLIKAKLG